jgi:hypothetical protein
MPRITLRLASSFAFLSLLPVCLPSAWAAAPRPLALADYFRIESVSQPALSPDGQWVAFVRTRIVKEENREQSEIWISRADGSEPPFRLTSPFDI